MIPTVNLTLHTPTEQIVADHTRRGDRTYTQESTEHSAEAVSNSLNHPPNWPIRQNFMTAITFL